MSLSRASAYCMHALYSLSHCSWYCGSFKQRNKLISIGRYGAFVSLYLLYSSKSLPRGALSVVHRNRNVIKVHSKFHSLQESYVSLLFTHLSFVERESRILSGPNKNPSHNRYMKMNELIDYKLVNPSQAVLRSITCGETRSIQVLICYKQTVNGSHYGWFVTIVREWTEKVLFWIIDYN